MLAAMKGMNPIVWTGMMAAGLAACAAMPSRMTEPVISTQQVATATTAAAQVSPNVRIMVPVSVNGQGPFEFLFDTGATHTVLSDQLAVRLGLPVNEPPYVRVRGVAGVSTAPTVFLSSVRSGELQLDQIRTPVLVGPVMEGVDGILGMQGLADKKINADFLRDQVHIVDSDGLPANIDYTVVQFELLARRFMVVEARVAGVRTKAVIDTGGTQTLGNPALLNMLVKRHRGQQLMGYRSSVVDATATPQATIAMRVPRIQLGKAEFPALPVNFGRFSVFDFWGLQNQPALLVGMDTLGMLGELDIDYRRKELHIRQR